MITCPEVIHKILKILCFYFKEDIEKVNAKFPEDLSPLEVLKRTRITKNMACLTLTSFLYTFQNSGTSQTIIYYYNTMLKFSLKAILVYYPDQEIFISNFI